MTVWVFVCDEEDVALTVGSALGAIPVGFPAMVPSCSSKAEPTKAELKELRWVAAAVCTALCITPTDAHLVQLLGGRSGMTNLDAAERWCAANQRRVKDDRPNHDLVDALTKEMQKHLLNQMH